MPATRCLLIACGLDAVPCPLLSPPISSWINAAATPLTRPWTGPNRPATRGVGDLLVLDRSEAGATGAFSINGLSAQAHLP